jgi:hypothetical protein
MGRISATALAMAVLLVIATDNVLSAPPPKAPEGIQAYKVTGLRRVIAFPDSSQCFRDNSGCTYRFESGRRFQIASFYRQVMDVFKATDETGASHDLPYDWKDIWRQSPGTGPDRNGALIIFGQYDFAGAKPDSLVIASVRNADGFTMCGVNIYNLMNDRWNLSGVLKAPDVLGACEIEFKVNKVTIPRHLRGFYHQLTFQNGHFEDTSDF